jgi:diguanylate cyclase (GGDEF)-like protein
MNPALASARIALVTVVAIISVTVYIDKTRMTQHREQERMSTAEKLDSHRTRIEGRLNSSISYSIGLRSFVLSRLALNETINFQNFAAFAETLPNVEQTVLGLQLAPDGIVRFVIPESDRKFIGSNLLDNTKYNDTVQRAIAIRRVVVDGPRMLSQGVVGLVARHPVFTPDDQFWGFSTVVIDFERLASASALKTEANGLRLALRGKDGKGSEGEVFFGDAGIFDLKPIVVDIHFQNGSWQIAGIPVSGWSSHWPGRSLFIVASIIIALLVVYLIWRNSQQKYQLSLIEQRLRALAAEDSLTKLANRRTLQNHLEQEWKRAARMKTPLSLLVIDIDYFKEYNDHYGHVEGDNCLCTIANEIAAAANRPADLAARFGGEEFILLLPETALDKATSVAENLRLEIVSREISHADDAPFDHVSISIGVASCNPLVGNELDNQKAIQKLLESADKCLYRAKRNGRNQVIVDKDTQE